MLGLKPVVILHRDKLTKFTSRYLPFDKDKDLENHILLLFFFVVLLCFVSQLQTRDGISHFSVNRSVERSIIIIYRSVQNV